MYGHPWYRNYPPNVSYNPYLHSSYQRSSPFDPVPARVHPRSAFASADADEEMRNALAERRARRAQWLPDEQDDDDDYDYDDDLAWKYQRRKQEEALFRQRALEAQQKEAERQRQEALRHQEVQRRMVEQRRQQELQRKAREAEEARKRTLDQQRQQRVQEEHRRRSAELKKNMFDSQVPQWAMPPRSAPGGYQEDSSKSIPTRVRQQSPLRQPPSSPSPKPSDIAPEQTRASPRPPSPAKSPSPQLQSKHTLEEQNEAASRIQQQYRIHSSFRTLSQLEKQFETLKKDFVYPHKIDFSKGADDTTISVLACRPPSDFDKFSDESEATPMEVDGADAKLAYTSTNYALHTYSDALDKLLIKLDEVESWGQKAIRMRRRGIVKAIERETSKLERYWKQAWTDHMAKQSAKAAHIESTAEDHSERTTQDQPESDPQPMETDSEPVEQPSQTASNGHISIPIHEGPLAST